MVTKADKRSVATDALETLGQILTPTDLVGRDAIHLAVEPVTAGEILYAGQHVGVTHSSTGYIASTKITKKIGIVDPFIIGPVQKGQKFWFILYPRQITSLRHVWSHPDFVDSDHIVSDTSTSQPLISEPVLASNKKQVLLVEDDTPTKKAIESLLAKEPSVRITEDAETTRIFDRLTDEYASYASEEGVYRSILWVRNYAEEVGLDYDELIQGAHDYLDHGKFLSHGGLLESESVPDKFWTHFQNITGRDGGSRDNFFSCSC